MARKAFTEQSRYVAFLAVPSGLALLALCVETIRNGFYTPDGTTTPYAGGTATMIGLLCGLGGLVALIGATRSLLLKRR